MRTRMSALSTLALLILGLLLALLTLKLVLGFVAGTPTDGWKDWLLLGLLFFTAEQVSALRLPPAPRQRRPARGPGPRTGRAHGRS